MSTYTDTYLTMVELYLDGIIDQAATDAEADVIHLESAALAKPVIRPDGLVGIDFVTPLTAEQRAELLRLAELDRIEDETHVSQFGWL